MAETKQTAEDRQALLAEAQLLGINLHEIGTEQPDGAVTLDWDVLAQAIEDRKPPWRASTQPTEN